MALSDQVFNILLSRVRAQYPGWQDVDDPRFVIEEVNYKRAAAQKAKALLGTTELEGLFATGDYTEILRRFKVVGEASRNLLFLSIPAQGDLAVLNRQNIDQTELGRALIDLVHAGSPSADRLERYFEFLDHVGMPRKWQFPTYLLFVCHPQTDCFIKPSAIKPFLETVGESARYSTTPTGQVYAGLIDVISQLRTTLQPYKVKDMIDVQSFLWVSKPLTEKEKLRNELGPTPKSIPELPAKTDQQQAEEPYFSMASFQLLSELHDNRTQTFYSSNKVRFKQHVEDPLRRLFADVAASLPPVMTKQLETSQRILAKIAKNDYGKGGAWDYLWGAFYPKAGKRTEDAQLYIWLNRDSLQYGFYIGEYGDTSRNQFIANAKSASSRPDKEPAISLSNVLGNDFSHGGGEAADLTDTGMTWQEWLKIGRY